MRQITPIRPDTVERMLKWLAIVLALGFVALFVFSATLRLMYPYEVEWMEGSMIDHAIRVLHHLPIYTAPSVTFTPWLYTSGYYYAVAGMMHLTGVGFLAGRLVSVIATVLTAVVIGAIIHRSTGEKALAFFGAALYIASYHATGYYFDIARNDALFTLTLVLAAFLTLFDRPGKSSGYLPALLLLLCFGVKQQALPFGFVVGIWLGLRYPKSLMYFVLTVLTVGAPLWLFANSHGWFSYYVFRIPAAKMSDFSALHALGVLPDYVLGCFTVTTIAIVGLLVQRARSSDFWRGPMGLMTLLWFCAIASGAMSLGNDGGYKNVMMPFAAFSAVLLPTALHELAPRVRVAGFVWLALLLQFGQLAFDPTGEKILFASDRQRAGAAEIVHSIAAIPGDVYIPYHGFIAEQAGKSMHAHVLAVMDVMHMHDTTSARLARDFDSAYANRFSAVVLDESKAFEPTGVRGYRFLGKLVATPNIGLTRVAGEATRPNLLWVRDPNLR